MLLAMTEGDAQGLTALVQPPAEVRLFPPFLDAAPLAAAAGERAAHRARLARAHRLDSALPWLVVVAMMRADAKRRSYLALAEALDHLRDLPWRLVVIGDGEARAEIEVRLRRLGEHRALCLGALPESEVPPWLAAADLYLWPAFREAYGLAMLEAQAAGLPVVACREGGVAAVVEHGHSGILVADRSMPAFAAEVRRLLLDPDLQRRLGAAAARRVAERHDLASAGRRLAAALDDAARIHARRREAARCAS
jgi:glycosyltransferase involved in cell wall biosynthesis